MADASTSQLVDIAGAFAVVVRWLVLLSSTILVLFVTWLVLGFLWSRGDKEELSIRPFVVVDPSGNLKNAEFGFAQILYAQMAERQDKILQARTLLNQAASGKILAAQVDDALRVPENPQEPARISNWLKVQPSTQEKIDLKIQGVDVSGIISWVKAQLTPEPKGLAFTAHIASDGEVTIAGDISDLKVKDISTLYVSPAKRSPIAALNDLALELFQLRLVGDDARLRELPLLEFGDLVDHLSEAVSTNIESKPDAERRDYYKSLGEYFAKVLAKHGDWFAMMVLAAQTARLGGDYAAAQKYFGLALEHEKRARPNEQDEVRRQLINASLNGVIVASNAQTRTKESVEDAAQLIKRRVLDGDGDAASVDRLRQGFQLLYDAKGEGSYASIAGLHGIPGWYSWHRTAASTPRQNLFLPWSRAFLLNLERAARGKVPDFALACWDWTKGPIPKSFSDKNLPNGNKNPLVAAYIDLPQSKPPIKRFTSRHPAPADQLPSPQDVASILALNNWTDFSVALEDLSSLVHAWTGGDMGIVAFASYDPLYYAHQCNVDRLWAVWQKAHEPLEGLAAMDNNLLDIVLEPFGIKVRDVLDTKKLGYIYD